jgi:quercetin dioxygenase-like cupin family protein
MTMTATQSANHGVVFSVGSIHQDLVREEAYARKGHTARTLVREPGLRVVLFAMKAGARIAEHSVDEAATVHVLSGQLRLRLPSGAVELGADQLLLLERAVPHDVEALADARFLLTLGWKNHS